jgi:Glycosyl hydrolases family 28
MNLLRTIPFAALVLFFSTASSLAHIQSAPVPTTEPTSPDFSITADQTPIPVYLAKIAPADDRLRWHEMDDIKNSATYADHCSFAPFDIDSPATLTITCPNEIHSAKILPTSFNLHPQFTGKQITLTIIKPQNLTLEINDDPIHSLHLFASPIDQSPPSPTDPNVIYFGPGIHDIKQTLNITDNQTLYLAPGSILRAIGPGGSVVSLHGSHISLRGRGILDGSLSPIHSRNLLLVHGSDITIDGIILRDSSTWNLPIRQSNNVTITNLKILGSRSNSDGIDICNSQNITIDNCFLRTLDDLIVVKSDKDQGEVHHVTVKNCILWNQVAHALSIGAELRENVDDVLFTDCDVIHDIGREWTLRIYHCDSATITNIRFENIRIEQTKKLISLWIGKQIWTRDQSRGHIQDVTFKNIQATSTTPPQLELKGYDPDHAINNVTFTGITINNQPLTPTQIKSTFANTITILSASGTPPESKDPAK